MAKEGKRPLYEHYTPEAILLGSKEYDCSETSIKIIQAYCKLSTKFKLATWEEVADELGLSKDKRVQRQITGTLTLAAGAYRDLYNQPHPYTLGKQED